MQEPSAHLLARCIEGDTEAFAQLVAEQQAYVYNLSLSLLGEAEEARDLAQDALLRVWQRLPSFRGESRFTTWLYRLVVNLGINRLAKLRRRPAEVALEGVSLPDPSRYGASPEEMLSADEWRKAIWRTVDSLPEKYRIVITLYYQHDRSYTEIAQILQLPLNTVKTHLSRARRMLASRFAETEGDDHGV